MGRSDAAPTTAAFEGAAWSPSAAGWAEHWARLAAPAREAVADAVAIGPDASVLDIGCGSGEFCRLAADRGAAVSGIDAAPGMIEIASRRVPEADLRVGPMERLPWDDDSFDLVTAFNALQFAVDFVAALVEARRVAQGGGRIAICNWGRLEDRDLAAVLGPLRELDAPRPPDLPASHPPAVGEPGVLEELARRAGLAPDRTGEVEAAYEVPDLQTLERALLVSAGVAGAREERARDVVRRVVGEDAEPFRRLDGSYRFENKFRYLIAAA